MNFYKGEQKLFLVEVKCNYSTMESDGRTSQMEPGRESLCITSRQDRGSAIERARERTRATELLEQYRAKSTVLQSTITMMSEELQTNQPNHKELRGMKKVLEAANKTLGEIVAEMKESDLGSEAEENHATLAEAAENLLTQYRMLYPKASSSASSSKHSTGASSSSYSRTSSSKGIIASPIKLDFGFALYENIDIETS